jgi:hypothetical protein
MCEVLGSIPSSKKKKNGQQCLPRINMWFWVVLKLASENQVKVQKPKVKTEENDIQIYKKYQIQEVNKYMAYCLPLSGSSSCQVQQDTNTKGNKACTVK